MIISNLSKSFGDKIILQNFSFSFPNTGVFAFTGNSGVGKTTLLRIIAGLDTEYSGQITDYSLSEISMSFQEHRLFPWLTALDNVLVSIEKPTSDNRKKARELLSTLGFTLEEMNLRPYALSGGMKQRVSLCRAFMKSSKIYLLDEATKELDRELATTVLDIIKEYSKRAIVIMTTHNASDIDYLGATEIKL